MEGDADETVGVSRSKDRPRFLVEVLKENEQSYRTLYSESILKTTLVQEWRREIFTIQDYIN